ncbi:glycosyltransferase involved in cell wall biosynthesis [Curtobacterium herbarum]|uniref:glycosyltransferase n=1 Tax=Curtobacterium herbarum TaxID=150122 RepID=UPI0020A19E89|nr:glycosyltransferase [Curtobacterium herbarum]MCP1504241.1 glycosyltransferase involved in cell wall biosynthesis [Curtobacterium herbarum]
MRILLTVTYVSSDGAFGGPVSVAMSQAAALDRAGHDVTLLAGWDGNAKLVLPGVEVALLRSTKVFGAGFVLTRTPKLNRWLRNNLRSFDVVHVHGGRHAFDVAVSSAARRTGRPYFVQTHGMVVPSSRIAVKIADRIGVLRMLRFAQSVLTLTGEEAHALQGLDPRLAIKSIRNGIEPTAVREVERDLEVLFLARLQKRKRVLAFAEMTRLVHETHPAVRFTVIGPDEGDLAALLEFIDEHPEVPIKYEGAVGPGDAPRRLARASIYVLPSVGEVFPMTVLEALSVGTPTVVVDDCGIADELSQQGAAVVSRQDVESLAASVRDLLDDSQLQAELTANGIAAVENVYSADAVAQSLLTRYSTAKMLPGVLWITNTSAPYRVPIWSWIARSTALEVLLLETDKRLAHDDNNRGRDWEVASQAHQDFVIRSARTSVVKKGEGRFYLGWVKRRDVCGKRAVLLGGWESPVYWVALFQAKLARVRTVGFYESHLASQGHHRGPIAALRRRFFSQLDAVVTPGPAATEAVVEMGVPRRKVFEGFNAVDISPIRKIVEERKQQLRRPEGGPRLIYVGQLIPRKNVRNLILALDTVPKATLTIVGTGSQREELEEVVQRSVSDPSRVQFVGYVSGSDVPALMADHDVLVLPSMSEVWGLVVNEALACGLQVVVSRRAGVARSVESHPGVFLCGTEVEDLRDALLGIGVPERVSAPPIWRETPEAFGEVFLRAMLEETVS